MPWMSAGIGIAGSLLSGSAQSGAAQTASDLQQQASVLGAAEQQRQFDTMVNLLNPYTQAGAQAVGQQQDLLGMRGADTQTQAINQLQQSPLFSQLLSQGQNALLENAGATGGLRGGDVAGAMSQFSPQMLADLYNSQLKNLGGLSSLGQAAAVMKAQQGNDTSAGVANALANAGAAAAGGILSKSAIDASTAAQLANKVGMVTPSLMSGYSGGSYGEYFPSSSHVTPRQNW